MRPLWSDAIGKLKICCPKGRAGSSTATGINKGIAFAIPFVYSKTSFRSQQIDLSLFQKIYVRGERNEGVERVADTEQKRDTGQRRRPHAAQIKDESGAVIDRVRDDGFKEHIVRLSESVKRRVENVLKSEQNVKAEKDHHKAEEFVDVGKL